MQGQFNGFRFHSTCYICKRTFEVFEGTQAYDQVKRNFKGMHCCEDCKHRIELEARLQFGRRLLTGKD
ncbi:hypothetical protein D7M11_26865 [Paenibacillus ginsengarvi]|uniref:DUF2197 domain-containing protein n=1 Tax=Paenibacillus ginsengarvi TaxID=400777 RepID=A0A3B0BR03_9BACL|nr:hypothetical protein D7M11_26865 [Paenibacillus ginsengarvi]